MRTNRLFLALLVAVLCMCNLSAQEVIPTDSVTHNKWEKKTLSYTQNILKELNDKILLPKEVNVLIKAGKDEQIYAYPQWEDVYFKHDSVYSTFLIVPLKATYKTSEINMELNVVRDNLYFHRIVTAQFVMKNDSITEYMSVNSNIFGDCVGAYIYDKDNMIEEIIPVSKKRITDSIYKPKVKSKSRKRIVDKRKPFPYHYSAGKSLTPMRIVLEKASEKASRIIIDPKGRQSARVR